MKEIIIQLKNEDVINDTELNQALVQSLSDQKKFLKKVLLVPPDYTRLHSGAGKITAMLYKMLKDTCEVDVIPALGTHEPMTEKECIDFFGSDVPFKNILKHNWKNDTVKIGEVPADYISEVSEGLIRNSIFIEVNKLLLDKTYDLILSIGQVVPHEVVGMANYNKNMIVGLGGYATINQSHMLGAVYGMERVMGRDLSPVRNVFDYAEEHFFKNMPINYILTVTTQKENQARIHGLYIGRNRKLFEEAVKLSQEKNLTYIEKPIRKALVFLNEREFKSTWLGNKAIYRTRMAIEDGGELIILAPGVKKFGEDAENDRLIRKYGYQGRLNILKLCETNDDLKQNLSVAAHLIHGSSDGRFSITYAVEKLTRDEIESVHFKWMRLKDAYQIYNPEKLKEGFNTLENGEEIYYIGCPALGLWIDRRKLLIH